MNDPERTVPPLEGRKFAGEGRGGSAPALATPLSRPAVLPRRRVAIPCTPRSYRAAGKAGIGPVSRGYRGLVSHQRKYTFIDMDDLLPTQPGDPHSSCVITRGMIPLRASEFPQGHLRKERSSYPRRGGRRTYRYLYGILDEGDPRYHVCDGWGMVLRILPPPIPGPMISPARPLPPGSGCSSCRRDVSPPPHAQEGGSSDLQRQWFCQSTRAGGETPGRLDLPALGVQVRI